MKQTTIPMKNDAKLVVRTSGDVYIEGSDQPQLTGIVDDGDSFRMQDDGGAILLHARSDAKLRIPNTASLVIERVSGDASVRDMHGAVSIQKVSGDLQFQGMGSVSIDNVGGDCVFKDISGKVAIGRIGGDLDGFKTSEIECNGIGGDVELSAVSGMVRISAGGDVHLQLADEQVSETHVRAGGDIHLVVLETAQANLQLSSKNEKISVQACGQHANLETDQYMLPLGQGGAVVELSAGGDIKVREGKEAMGEFSFVFDDMEESWRDFGREIEDKIRHSMHGVSHELRHAGWQASHAMHRAADKMADFSYGGNYSGDGKVYGFGFGPQPAQASAQQKKAASDEERMMVLKMLQEKKITVEEAEKLLQALEG